MKNIIILIIVLNINLTFAQDYKNDISIVQFSASFVKDAEMSLNKFKDYNIHSFYMEHNRELFKTEKIRYLPTVVLYHNGKEITRVESGINLKLPDNCDKKISKHIDELLKNKF